jgi:hypothetical protein
MALKSTSQTEDAMPPQPAQQKPPTEQLIEVFVSELTNPMIDWLIASHEGVKVCFEGGFICLEDELFYRGERYSPSTDPSQGHPILEREKIQLRYIDRTDRVAESKWLAQDCRFSATSQSVVWREFGRSYATLELGYTTGPTMLVAAMRFMIAKYLVGKQKDPAISVPTFLLAA